MKTFVWYLAVAFTVVFCAVPSTYATIIVDQSQTELGGRANKDLEWVQSFKQANNNITGAALYVYKAIPGNSYITATLRLFDALNGNELANGSGDITIPGPLESGGWIDVDFGGPVWILPETEYFLAVEASDWFGITFSDSYPRGTLYLDGAPYSGGNSDIVFKTYAEPTVKVDIKPGNDPNSINLKSKGVIPVAILSVGVQPGCFAIDETMMTALVTNTGSNDVTIIDLKKIPTATEDYSQTFFINLESGLNMISLPLEPLTQRTARDLMNEIGATMVIKLDAQRSRFDGFTETGSGDGFPLGGFHSRWQRILW